MKPKNVLFISNIKLDNPMRGTPLRIYKFILNIKKENNVWVSSQTNHKDFGDQYFEIPKVNLIKKFLFFHKIIKENKIDIVISATGTSIKLLVVLKLLSSLWVI